VSQRTIPTLIVNGLLLLEKWKFESFFYLLSHTLSCRCRTLFLDEQGLRSLFNPGKRHFSPLMRIVICLKIPFFWVGEIVLTPFSFLSEIWNALLERHISLSPSLPSYKLLTLYDTAADWTLNPWAN